jgi:hypothetical protein
MLFWKLTLTFLPLSSYQKTLPHNLTPIPSPVKTKLSLCLIKHHALKTGGGTEMYLSEFWTSVSCLAALPPGKQLQIPIELEARWDPKPIWTTAMKIYISVSTGNKPSCPACIQSLYCLSYHSQYLVFTPMHPV